jgi:TonB-dependent starch-binding outer membrane protein SusC
MLKIKSILTTLCLFAGLAVFAQRSVSGKVVDSKSGAALSGVNVSSRAGSITTDADGNFTVSVSGDRNNSVSFSLKGYQSQSVILNNGSSTTINLVPTAATEQTTEVVVTGYRSLSRRSFTGASTTVSGEKIRNVPIASFDQALQGQTPGLLMRSTSGQPGNSGSIVVRGKGSINLSTEPTFIVDGIQISGADFAAINPNDIENISVLKDGLSTALYGSRGSNGVVVVTTKRGRAGKPNLEIEAYTGWSQFPEFRDFRLMTTNEKIDYELRRGGTSLEFYSAAVIDSMRKINTDWEKLLTQTGRTNSIAASASGGSDNTRYYTSVNYFKQEGTLKNTGYDRITGRVNLNQTAGDFLFGINVSGTYSNYSNTAEQNAGIGSPLNALQWANPYEQEFVKGFYNAAGNFVFGGNDLTRQRVTETFQPMPATELYWNNNTSKSIRLIAGGNAEYKIPFVKGLSVKTQYGIDYRQYDDFRFVDRRTYAAGSNPRPLSGASANFRTNSFATDFSLSQRITNTNSLNYVKKIGDHSIDVGAYYEYIQTKAKNNGRTLYGLASNFQNDAGSTINADLLPRLRFGGNERRIESYFGLLTYGFKNKYFINANLRRDGASVFGPRKKYATFGGVGVGWALTDEKFMENIKGNWLNNAKVRVSYGSVGNGGDQLPPYAWQAIIANRLYNSINGLIATTLENQDLQWEARVKFNAGLDYTVLNNRVTGSFEFYNETTKDFILDAGISPTTGFSFIRKNIGSVRNRGVELNMSATLLDTRGIRVVLNGNITFNKNEITKLADRDSIPVGTQQILAIGQPISALFLNEYVGVNPANGAALYRKLDGSTTENMNIADRRIVGAPDPRQFGGFGLNVEYKGFTLATQFAFQAKSFVLNYERNFLENPDYYFDNVSSDLLREWQRPGDITDIPNPNNLFQANTTRFLESSSFVRLRNVSLSYNFPAHIAKNLKLKNLMFYVNGTNLWTATKYRGRDPETATSVQAGAQYPALRTVTAGLRVNF